MDNYRAVEAHKIWMLLNDIEIRLESMRSYEQECQWTAEEHKQWDVSAEIEERLDSLQEAIEAVCLAQECVERVEE